MEQFETLLAKVYLIKSCKDGALHRGKCVSCFWFCGTGKRAPGRQNIACPSEVRFFLALAFAAEDPFVCALIMFPRYLEPGTTDGPTATIDNFLRGLLGNTLGPYLKTSVYSRMFTPQRLLRGFKHHIAPSSEKLPG